ncbi:MAG: type I restriction enzyme HsdR N-terminal domain-containing protein [Flavipsychrobacter sp.]|nr:type I restriction enzyme HsdR N-terminal domain-containing protein [Flavipsychrobacter sp.]
MELDYLNQLLDNDDFEDIFKDFNFDLLDSPDFKEDAVREEIIYPILKSLGYSASSENKIVRSKALKHPFYYFGTKQYNVSIVPDYTFEIEGKYYWILDAKRPTEDIKNGKNVFQAYSYAMHPEIQSEIYCLCNGKELVVFNIKQHTPLFSFEIKDLKNNWKDLKKHLLPEFVKKPHLKDYSLDLGLFLMKIGDLQIVTEPLPFEVKDLHFIAKLNESSYSLNDVFGIKGLEDTKFVATFDFEEDRYKELLNLLPEKTRIVISRGLSSQPFRYHSENPEETPVRIIAQLGRKIFTNSDESYLPFEVIKFEKWDNGI